MENPPEDALPTDRSTVACAASSGRVCAPKSRSLASKTCVLSSEFASRDEFLPAASLDFPRSNFSRNTLVPGAGDFPLPDIRLYSEVGNGFLNDGGNQRWEPCIRRPGRPSGFAVFGQ
jgi:hypothetical protein